MSRCGRKIALSALLLALFVCSTGVTAQDVGPEVPKPPVKLEDIKSQLDKIQNDLKTLQNLDRLAISVPALEDQIKQLSQRLETVINAVTEIEKMTRANTTRIAKAFDPGARPATASTIRLQNSCNVRATVVLGGVAYDVQPNQTLDIKNRQLGLFDYYVLADGFGQISSPVTRELKANEIYTIYINPR